MLAPAIRAAGVTALYLFGSNVRGTVRPDSDIDLLFDAPLDGGFSLLDQAKLQRLLSEELDRPIDFIERRALRVSVLKSAQPELLRVF